MSQGLLTHIDVRMQPVTYISIIFALMREVQNDTKSHAAHDTIDMNANTG